MDVSDNAIVNKLSYAIITHYVDVIKHFTSINITYLYEESRGLESPITKYHMSKNTRVPILTKIHLTVSNINSCSGREIKVTLSCKFL